MSTMRENVPLMPGGNEGLGVWALLELTDAFMLTITNAIKCSCHLSTVM